MNSAAIECVPEYGVEIVDYLFEAISLVLPDNTSSIDLPETTEGNDSTKLFFKISSTSMIVLRNFINFIDVLKFSTIKRFALPWDIPLLMVRLILNAPWVKKEKTQKGIKWFKYHIPARDSPDTEFLKENFWKDCHSSNLLKLSQLEAQPWIILCSLLGSKAFVSIYEVFQDRKEQLLRVRKYLNKILLDQIPQLNFLQRLLDELSLMDVSGGINLGKEKLLKPFIVDEICCFKEKYMEVDFKAVAQEAVKGFLDKKNGRDDIIVRLLADYFRESIEYPQQTLSVSPKAIRSKSYQIRINSSSECFTFVETDETPTIQETKKGTYTRRRMKKKYTTAPILGKENLHQVIIQSLQTKYEEVLVKRNLTTNAGKDTENDVKNGGWVTYQSDRFVVQLKIVTENFGNLRISDCYLSNKTTA
eukprot:augustus_masked-scaffold_3-processed-gene-6.64-mRNA-1 protein AED:0.34 eAED:0.34 QI:0/-1/0/1/-1/1/1/0/417